MVRLGGIVEEERRRWEKVRMPSMNGGVYEGKPVKGM